LIKRFKKPFYCGAMRRPRHGRARKVLTTFLAAVPPSRSMRLNKTMKSFYLRISIRKKRRGNLCFAGFFLVSFVFCREVKRKTAKKTEK